MLYLHPGKHLSNTCQSCSPCSRTDGPSVCGVRRDAVYCIGADRETMVPGLESFLASRFWFGNLFDC
jgi:hypothetical protein